MVIARYITKEIFESFFAITFILLFVALSNRFVSFLAKAAAGQIPLDAVFKLVGLYVPEFFAMLAPVALFIGVLFTHTRLHADSEIAVLLTCGFDWAKITKITLFVGIIVSILVGVLTLGVIPHITEYRERLQSDSQAIGVMHSITAGQFQTVEDEQLVFYVEDVDSNGKLHNIFIAQQPDSENLDKPITVVTAKYADMKQTNNPFEFYLVLYDGHRYVGAPGTANYVITSFKEYGRELKHESGVVPSFHRIRSTLSIINSEIPGDKAELQWRLAMPIASIILVLIAVSLAQVKPRQGRFSKFLPAILIYMVYYNSLTLTRRAVAENTLSPYIGTWVVHIFFLLFAWFLLMKVSGRLNQLKYNLSINRKST